ncbi:hypothetical protein [Kordia sp.]|uniref:hypothetical protein n=1 Tax=Kordia sp. TaxID=1965332 RepID=UPI003D2C3606
MKKATWSLKKIDLKKFTIAAVSTQNNLIGGATNRCTSQGCANYECKPRRAV